VAPHNVFLILSTARDWLRLAKFPSYRKGMGRYAGPGLAIIHYLSQSLIIARPDGAAKGTSYGPRTIPHHTLNFFLKRSFGPA
jgi:hypothetical protein